MFTEFTPALLKLMDDNNLVFDWPTLKIRVDQRGKSPAWAKATGAERAAVTARLSKQIDEAIVARHKAAVAELRKNASGPVVPIDYAIGSPRTGMSESKL